MKKANFTLFGIFFSLCSYSQKCDCDIFPLSAICQDSCIARSLQTGTEKQLVKRFAVSNETAKKITTTPNRKSKVKVEDFQETLPYKHYKELEQKVYIYKGANITQNNINGDNVAGDKIINNTYVSEKAREVSDSLLKAIISYLPDKNFPVRLYMRNKDSESWSYCEKIKIALQSKGYNNVYISSSDYKHNSFTGDPEADLDFQRRLLIEIRTDQLSTPAYKYLMIMVPVNIKS